jgi:hypothetical protein
MEGKNVSNDFSFLKELFGDSLFKGNQFFFFEDYEVISLDNVEMFLSMFRMSNQVNSYVEYGYFRVINNKFILIIDDFKRKLKSIFLNFIIPNRKEVLSRDYFASLFVLYNIVLIFSPEFSTIYNIKKEIISHLHLYREFHSFNQLIISEYIFINLLNKKYRKSCVSWDYRKFLAKFIYTEHCIDDCYNTISTERKDSIYELNHIYEQKNKTLISIFLDTSLDISPYNNIEKYFKIECLLLNDINDFSPRNYYLWNYIIFLFNRLIHSNPSFHNIFSTFIFSIFVQNPLDYSAFSFIVNSLVRINFDKLSVTKLIEYFNMISNSKIGNKGYLKDTISIMLNKFKYN